MNVLQEIVAATRRDLAAGHAPGRARRLEQLAGRQEAPCSLAAALVRDGVRVIAEVKRRSPSAGELAANVDPAVRAAAYERAGAAAVSVLTDSRFFGGSLGDLAAVRTAGVGLPVLRKDFIIDELQVLEARAFGADAVLLIAGVLEPGALRRLLKLTHDLGMEALVEAHARSELHDAIECGARVIGINNRDLQTFTTSLDTTLQLASYVPADRILVSESGIRSRDDIDRLAEVGVRAVLVGSALMRSDDPVRLLQELVA